MMHPSVQASSLQSSDKSHHLTQAQNNAAGLDWTLSGQCLQIDATLFANHKLMATGTGMMELYYYYFCIIPDGPLPLQLRDVAPQLFRSDQADDVILYSSH